MPGDTPRHEAKARLGEWEAEVEMRIATLRAQRNGEGQPLTKQNAIALAGRWYSWFVRQYESDPGPPKRWREMSDHLVWNVIYPEAPESYHENQPRDPGRSMAYAPASYHSLTQVFTRRSCALGDHGSPERAAHEQPVVPSSFVRVPPRRRCGVCNARALPIGWERNVQRVLARGLRDLARTEAWLEGQRCHHPQFLRAPSHRRRGSE